jgi:group I intron endonuclease
MNKKKYHYVYVTTNLKNGKKYVGDHSTDNLDDGYLGSGNLFTEKVKEYGKNNFQKEIIEFFNTKIEAFKEQEKWINEHNTLVPNGYNISPTGGHNVSKCWNELSLKKKRKSVKKFYDEHPEVIENIRQKITGIKRSEETKMKLRMQKIGEKNPMYGKTTSDKQKESVKRAHLEGRVKLTEEGRQKIIESGKKRKGTKNKNKKSDAIKYELTSPAGKKFIIFGAVDLQKFCKDNKLQFHVLKNNEGNITNEMVVGNKIYAKNTIGWKIQKH